MTDNIEFITSYKLKATKQIRRRSKTIANSSVAIKRSREMLKEAEAAVARSFAVVELSKRFVDSIENKKEEKEQSE